MHIARTYSNIGSDSTVAYSVLSSGNVSVPSSFLGMHFKGWPVSRSGVASPTPNFPYGYARLHDYGPLFNGGIKWSALNPTNVSTIEDMYASASVAWSKFDEAMVAHNARGAKILYNIFGCPSWLAGAQYQVLDVYNIAAGCANPTDLTKVRLFVQAVLNRHLVNGIQVDMIEGWNEPRFSQLEFTANASTNQITFPVSSLYSTNSKVFFTTTGTLPAGLNPNTFYYLKTSSNSTTVSLTSGGADVDITGAGTGVHTMVKHSSFYWGTPSELAQLQRAIYQEVKAFNPNIVVASPAFDLKSTISPYCSASDGASGFGRDWQDIVGCHPYNTTLNPNDSGDIGLFSWLSDLRVQCTSSGMSPSIPLFVSEQGWIPGGSSPSVGYFDVKSDLEQAVKMWRHLAVSASMGMQSHFYYIYEDLLGTPPLSTSSIKQQFLSHAATDFVGKTIKDCEVYYDGAVKLTFADGSSIKR